MGLRLDAEQTRIAGVVRGWFCIGTVRRSRDRKRGAIEADDGGVSALQRFDSQRRDGNGQGRPYDRALVCRAGIRHRAAGAGL